MKTAHKTKPAPAATGSGSRKLDRLGGAIKKPHITEPAPAQQPDYEAIVRQRWPWCIVLPHGTGPFAVVSFCDATIVSLHPDFVQAATVKDQLDSYGCAGFPSPRRCRVLQWYRSIGRRSFRRIEHSDDDYRRHAIFDLSRDDVFGGWMM